MPDRLQVLIRADGGAHIGAGHLMRTWSLAQALTEVGSAVRFAGTAESRELFADLGGAGEGWLVIDDPFSPKELGEHAGRCDLLVIDHYGLDMQFETACRTWAGAVMAIDDAPTRRHDCDVLLDQTWGRLPAEYGALVPGPCAVLAGSAHALLRPEFFRARISSTARRAALPNQSVFVALGATDTGRALIPCLESLRRAVRESAIDAVISSKTPHLAEIGAAAQRLGVSLHVDTADVASLMSRATIAVIAAGSVTWEACCAGLLPVLLVTADNQRDVAAALCNKGVAVRCDEIAGVGSLVAALLEDPVRLKDIASRAASVCDGLGARRVAMVLKPEMAGDSLPVTLRPATMDDAQTVFEWQSAAETRRFARNPEVPEPAAHCAWMAARLQKVDSLFNIVMHNGDATGVVRLDRMAETDYSFEVSIYIAPDRHGRGIGKAALRLARRLLPEAELLAHVLPQNQVSRALFLAAGYVPGPDWFRCTPQIGHA